MRLDKYLADMNVGTRKELKTAIRKQRVTVNGEIVRDSAYQLNGDETVCIDGEEIVYQNYEYYMLNKPSGVLCTTEDRKRTTVLDLLGDRRRKDLFPVGRLDIDTTGLVLLTNDGALTHRLLMPKFHVDKVYEAIVSGIVTERDIRAFAKGLKYDENLTAAPADLQVLPQNTQYAYRTSDGTPVVLESEEYSKVRITIHEGKFHQIKKMFQAVGKEVLSLKRISIGPLVLDPDLKEGEARPLTEQEIEALSI